MSLCMMRPCLYVMNLVQIAPILRSIGQTPAKAAIFASLDRKSGDTAVPRWHASVCVHILPGSVR